MHRHRLGDIWPAEIQHQRLAGAGSRRAQRRIVRQRGPARVQCRIRQIEIQETGTGDLDLGENRFGLETGGDLFGNDARIGLGGFCRRQRAVALKLRQVGPVGGCDAAKAFSQAFGGERRAGNPRQVGRERTHCW